MMGAATEKARLPRFSFVLGIESCCEVDDLSCLAGDVRKVQETSHIRWLMYCKSAITCKVILPRCRLERSCLAMLFNSELQ